jgi:hypothetical protein
MPVMGDQSNSQRPDWWEENSAIRAELGLPDYEPSQFKDGVYTHRVISGLEERYGVQIRLVGDDTRYGDDWDVRVDGTVVLSLGRHCDTDGNTVFEMDSNAFVDRFEEAFGADQRA